MELSIKVKLSEDAEIHRKYRASLIDEFYQLNSKMISCYENLKNFIPPDDVFDLKNEIEQRYSKQVPRLELGQEVTVEFGYRNYYEGYNNYQPHIAISIPELNYFEHYHYDSALLGFSLEESQIISAEGLQLIKQKIKEIQEEIECERQEQ